MAANISDDYAVINIGNLQCYYGYEVTDDKGDWCFEAKAHGTNERLVIPQSKIKARDKEDCAACLLDGIEQLLNDHVFTLPG